MSLSALIKKGGLRRIATATVATFATDEPKQRTSVATVATVAVATAPDKAANEPAHAGDFDGGKFHTQADVLALTDDPDCWAWPHSSAMNGQELDTLMARQALFCQRGAAPQDAERLADRLVNRDRDDDDRRLCLECRHLRGAGPYRCGNARAAGLHADLARDLVLILQRCHGYDAARLPVGVIVDAAPLTPASEPAPAPAPTPSAPTWRELDRAYLAHHQQCSACQCAGRGYGQRCAIGMQLWTAYSSMNSDLKG